MKKRSWMRTGLMAVGLMPLLAAAAVNEEPILSRQLKGEAIPMPERQ